MQVFKCKMCGGSLNIEKGKTIIECDFCGSKQTVPNLDDEKRANLYDRANHFRRNNDFDKALSIYETILNEDKTDAEAYWSILLCKFGVEYVEDPATHKRVPTINRTQFTSILKDVDYKNALKYADGYQRDIYEEEAKEIDKIQQGILAISGKEEPFDVFICYKETDHSGRRTIDSVLGQDLYHNLKNEGLKVFFSRITLEDKLGVAYEPYIFAALNSAKVMVVIGSKLEYFNAVWVKNEWSRYLSLIRNGEKKTLIPAYKDMDPYDLPEEFTHLQAQDMNKLGFMQDLVYGIKKIIGRTTPKTVVKETVVVDNHHDTAPLLRRAYLFLEDGDFDCANEYAEKVLDSNPECAKAYFIKLLAELGICKPELLLQSETVISEYSNYKRALRFADKKFGEELNNYSETIQKNIENARKQDIYEQACYAMQEGFFGDAIATFQGIIDYSDSALKIEKCKELIDIGLKEAIYNDVHAQISNSPIINDTILKQSISDLQSIVGYRDTEQKIAELQARLEKYYNDKRVAEEQAKIRAEEKSLRKLREAELRKIKIEKRKQKLKKTAKISVPSILALTLVLVLTFTLFIPLGKYNKANDLLNSGNYEEAIKIYEDLGGFSGSEAKIATINAVKIVENGEFEQGIKDALNAGVKVNLTYELNKGALPQQSKTENGISPVSCMLYAKENIATEKTYTYTKIEDFSGFVSPIRNGYDFDKWDLVSCGANVKSDNNTLNVRLIAVWEGFTIFYELNGGEVNGKNPIGYKEDDDSFTLINPIKTGYTFIGWTGTDLTDKTMEVIITSGSYGNRSYTAHWQAKTYNVTYDANGGVSSKTQDTATYDAEFV